MILTSAFLVFNQNTSSAATNDPTKLYIFTSPPSALADNSAYKCIFVQLQDSNGKPARALQDTTISLSSSLTYIGTVDSSITILKGDTFTSADFTSTFNPGTTAISASATGYATVLASITTVGPIPYAIAVYGFPSTLPADGNSYAAIMVQLQDSSGSPARAPQGGVQVTLSSSNTTVGTVTPVVRILEGQTYAIANFTTTTKAETEAKTQSAIVTAVAQGFTPNQVTITTTPVATNPNQLKIFVGPSKVPADQNSYKQIAVQLQNASGYAAVKQSDVMVTIASNDQSICKIDPITITIPQMQTYALATLNTTYKPGTANITAVATDFPWTRQSISTFGFTPSKLAIYCVPTSIPSDYKQYQTIQVQLQDAQGRPAKDPENDVNVTLSSSQPTVGVVSSTLTIPFGKTQATGNLTVTNVPGTTQITAQTSGYTTGQTTITTSLIDYYTIAASAGANGVITPTGNVTVNLGGSHNFNITANTGYHITDVVVDNASQGAGSSYTFTDLTSAHTIAASFAINTYNLNVTQTTNGQIDPGTSSVNYGATSSFTITPNAGYHIINITANGIAVSVTSPSGQSYQFNNVTGNCSLTATFAINTYAIRVTQTAYGKINPGTTSVDFGDSQTFTIIPNTGYHIDDVLVNGSSVGAVSSYTIQNVQGATTISATFATSPTPPPTPSPTPSPNPVPTIVIATTDNGTKVDLVINGNITSQQITNVTIATNQSTAITTVFFAVTGGSGTTGSSNFTIPKRAVRYGTTPTIYIDGNPAQDQGFAQDTNNYYVWFTIHFSTHEVSIVFKPVSPSPSPAAPSSLPPTVIYGVAVAVAIVAIVAVILVYKKKQEK